MQEKARINNQIRAKEVRVTDTDGSNIGIFPLAEAVAMAEERGLDLIEVSAKANPPVTRIMEYGKYLYEQKKKAKGSRGHVTETKSLQIKLGTGKQDLELKARRANEFLQEGNRVKIELFLAGRAKYLDQNFLKERLTNFLTLITEEYKIASEAQKSPKGYALIIERGKK